MTLEEAIAKQEQEDEEEERAAQVKAIAQLTRQFRHVFTDSQRTTLGLEYEQDGAFFMYREQKVHLWSEYDGMRGAYRWSMAVERHNGCRLPLFTGCNPEELHGGLYATILRALRQV